MPIALTTPQSWPSSTEVRLIAFSATLWPQRRIICDYSWGHLDGSGSFVPDVVPGATSTRVKRRIFDDSTTPSFATFVSNVPSAGTFRGEVETYIKALESLLGNVT